MTQRKPSSSSFPDWVEHQIRTAQADGAFDNLPGAGKPIPGIDEPQHELSWVASYLRREDADVAGLLPPALALAKEVEALPERLVRERSESCVRGIVEDLNERIRAAQRAPQVGPPMRVTTVSLDDAVAQWRVARPAVRAEPPVARPAPARRSRLASWLHRPT
ncbi:MAG: hypothetical protein QOH14_3479 [Pseudonocardiales bacterium]|nr:hypothetical protein [Pseudonocardiales bacterium]